MTDFDGIKKVLVIGAGPRDGVMTAQFDCATAEACSALHKSGKEVILLSSDPAAVVGAGDIADKVCTLPVTFESVRKIIKSDHPDAVIATAGGDSALDILRDLRDGGYFDEITPLGINPSALKWFADTTLFDEMLSELSLPSVASKTVDTVERALIFASASGYPVEITPAYVPCDMGRVCENETALSEAAEVVLAESAVGRMKISRSLLGCKKVDCVILRDVNATVMTVGMQEYIDPVGSRSSGITVTPVQTIDERVCGEVKSASEILAGRLGITGSCTVTFAVSKGGEWYVLEIKPRVTGAAMLISGASATSVSAAAAKCAVGFSLGEINFDTQLSENDYCAVRLADSEGGVIAFGRNFDSALRKAAASAEKYHIPVFSKSSDRLYLKTMKDFPPLPEIPENAPSFRKIGGGNSCFYVSGCSDSGFENFTPVKANGAKKYLVIGAGAFKKSVSDFCTVDTVVTLKKSGAAVIVLDNSIKTFFGVRENCDRFYFDIPSPAVLETILENEQPDEVIIQTAGESASVMAGMLLGYRTDVSGTPAEVIRDAGDTKYTVRLASSLKIPWSGMPGVDTFAVDAISDGNDVFIAGLLRGGAPDSPCLFATAHSDGVSEKILPYTRKISSEIGVKGIIHIKFSLISGVLCLCEVSPWTTENVPFVSGIAGFDLTGAAVRCMLGESLADIGIKPGYYNMTERYAVKMPVFTVKNGAAVTAGYVLGVGETPGAAIYNGVCATGIHPRRRGNIYIDACESEISDAAALAEQCALAGYSIYASPSVAAASIRSMTACSAVESQGLKDLVSSGKVGCIFTSPEKFSPDIKALAIRKKICVLASLSSAKALVSGMSTKQV